MPRKRRTQGIYRQPTKKEIKKILFTGLGLDELFDEHEIEDLMAAARRRIIGEFHYATEAAPRYKLGSGARPFRRTENYIWGLGCRPSDLATYVVRNMRRQFIKASQLPADIAELHPHFIDTVIWRVQYDIVLEVILTMRNREVWYDEGIGIWQICQSSVDEYLEYKRVARQLVKLDDRSYHGRVRSQSKARGVPEGVSVSFAG